jgi:hypothetical protein
LKDLVGKKLIIEISNAVDMIICEKIEDRKLLDSLIQTIMKDHMYQDTKIKELFDGVLSRIIINNVSYFMEIIQTELSNNREIIKNYFIENMNLIVNIVAKNQISSIVDDIIDNKVQKFLNSRKGDIIKFINPLLEYKLKDIGVTDLVLKNDLLVDNFIGVVQSSKTKKEIGKIASLFVDEFSSIKISEILEIVKIDSIEDLLEIIEPLLSESIKLIIKKIDSSEDKMIKLLNELFNNIIITLSEIIEFKCLIYGIDLQKETKKILRLILTDINIVNMLSDMIKDSLYKITNDENVVDSEFLKRDIQRYLKILISKEKETLSKTILPFFKQILIKFNDTLEIKTKEDILTILTNSSFNALERVLTDIVTSIDIQSVVENEIKNMDGKKIKGFFYSFAGSYFNKLIKYGLWGGLFGILYLIIIVLI